MRIRKAFRSLSAFVGQVFIALLKAVVTSAVVGLILVTVMHHMGVPVPSATDLLSGVSRLAHILS